jgi:hypothetical protein
MERTFGSSFFWQCKLKITEPRFNPVDGKTTPARHERCSDVRWDEKVCGRDAKAWQPRHKKDLFVFLKNFNPN